MEGCTIFLPFQITKTIHKKVANAANRRMKRATSDSSSGAQCSSAAAKAECKTMVKHFRNGG